MSDSLSEARLRGDGLSPFRTTPTMASSDITPTRQELPTAAPQPRRPLRREGAVFILTAEEQLLQDAMLMSSSPPPEPVLGKRTRQEGDNDEDDVEDDATTPAPQPQTSLPSISNITAAALRYATIKKLRPEQREEVEAFLLVSFWFFVYSLVLVSENSSGFGGRSSGQDIYCYLVN